MNGRSEKRREERLEQQINKSSKDYKEGLKEGIRQERGNFVIAMDRTKGIGDKLINRVLGELTKVYKGE